MRSNWTPSCFVSPAPTCRTTSIVQLMLTPIVTGLGWRLWRIFGVTSELRVAASPRQGLPDRQVAQGVFTLCMFWEQAEKHHTQRPLACLATLNNPRHAH